MADDSSWQAICLVQQAEMLRIEVELRELRAALASARLKPQAIWFCAHCQRWRETRLSLGIDHLWYAQAHQCTDCKSPLCDSCETLCQACEKFQPGDYSSRLCPACSHRIVNGMCRECVKYYKVERLEDIVPHH